MAHKGDFSGKTGAASKSYTCLNEAIMHALCGAVK